MIAIAFFDGDDEPVAASRDLFSRWYILRKLSCFQHFFYVGGRVPEIVACTNFIITTDSMAALVNLWMLLSSMLTMTK